jgi:hypothetical protein
VLAIFLTPGILIKQFNFNPMKTLKKILIVIAVLLAIPLITALFVKKTYTVEREIMIEMLRNQDNFSKWASMDPNMKQEYIGIDGKIGFISSWESDQKDVGRGEQSIINIKEGERIDYALHFIKPMEGRANAFMTTEAVTDNQTKVKWGFTGTMNYPMNIVLLFMNMDRMIGGDLETGLINLKRVMETGL